MSTIAEDLRQRFSRPSRAPEITDIITLQMTRDALLRQIEKLEGMVDKLENPDTKAFLLDYLKAEGIRIAIESMGIENLDPHYERKKLIADAQYRQNNRHVQHIEDARFQLETLRDQVQAIEARIQTLNNKKRSQ